MKWYIDSSANLSEKECNISAKNVHIQKDMNRTTFISQTDPWKY